MSTSQLQTALAMLIRLPEHNRVNIDEFLASYQLSPQDKENLRYLAEHREVNKFGYKMRRGRINFLIESIPHTLKYIDKDKLIKFIEIEFDPNHTLVHARKIYRAFRYFLAKFKRPNDNNLLKYYLGNLPDFFLDLMNFELLDSEIEFQGFQSDLKLTHSPLRHNRFEVMSLDYKIHDYIEKKRELPLEKHSSLTPKKGKTFLLFLGDDSNEYGYQLFQIDRTGVNFLEQARQGKNATLPSYYDDFVDCGLCK